MFCDFILEAFSETFLKKRKIRPMLFSPAPIRWIGAAINAMLIRFCRDVPVRGAPFVFLVMDQGRRRGMAKISGRVSL